MKTVYTTRIEEKLLEKLRIASVKKHKPACEIIGEALKEYFANPNKKKEEQQ